MSLRNFPPSEIVSTSSFTDERTPLMRSISGLRNQSSEHIQQSLFQGHLPSQKRTQGSIFTLTCIILTVVLERITFYGLLANLLLFLINQTDFNQSTSIGIVFTFTGLAWLMSTIGGIVADSFIGRYNAVWGSLLIYIVGVGMISASALITEHHGRLRVLNTSSDFFRPLALVALFVISVGEGAYKANVTAFGGDQLQAQDDTTYRRFFNWYYWSINFASFVAYTGIAYIEQEYTFTKGFGILFGCIVLATVTFCVCRSRYFCQPPSGHILKKMYDVIKEARHKKKEQATRDSSSQYYNGLEPMKSSLDYAMMKYGGSYLDTDVEEVKTMGRVMVIFAILIPYWAIYFQMNSTFLLQGLHMKLSDGSNKFIQHVKVVPAWLSLVDVSFVLVLIPIMDKLIYPWLDRKGWSLGIFMRISIGFLFAIASMVVAGGVEFARLRDPNCTVQEIARKNYTASCLSIAYQIPQYGLIGISEVFASVAGLEFAYKEAPKTMQSFVMGLFFFAQSAGSLIGGGLFELCSVFGWTPNLVADITLQKLEKHLSYYFFLLAGLLFVTWVILIVITMGSKLSFKQANPRNTPQVLQRSLDNPQA